MPPSSRISRLSASVGACSLALAVYTVPAGAQVTCPEYESCPIVPPVERPPKPVRPRSHKHYDTLESRYASFGYRWALDPQKEVVPKADDYFRFTLPPFATSSGTYPNTWSPLTTQGIFERGLWKDQADDFAGRCIYMTGSYSAGVANFESGLDKTRSTDTPFNTPRENKYVMGALADGVLLRGGSIYDSLIALGNANFASTKFFDIDSFEAGHAGDDDYRRVYAFALAGSDNFAYIGSGISDYAGGIPVDTRDDNLKPDDVYNISPAVLTYMLGMSGAALIDNRRADFCIPEYLAFGGPETQAGYIQNAWAIRAVVSGQVEGSWINVGKATGVTAYLAIGEALSAEHSPGCPDCEREGSIIRDWVAYDTLSFPQVGCASVTVYSSAALIATDQNPDHTGGSPRRIQGPVNGFQETNIVEPERHPAIIARGDVIVGDGYDETGANGFQTDVLRVNDVIHLQPRTAPPEFSRDTAPSDRVGLMYFDLKRNCLRVSVATPTDGTRIDDWRETPVTWVDVSMNMDAADPRRDTVGTTGDSANKQLSGDGSLAEAMDRGRKLAESGESPYLPPAIQVIPAARSSAAARSVDVTIMTSGFHGETPKLYYKIQGTGQWAENATAWIEIPARGIKAVSGMSEALAATLQPMEDAGLVTAPQSGQVVQFLAIHPRTGQSTGYSTRIP